MSVLPSQNRPTTSGMNRISVNANGIKAVTIKPFRAVKRIIGVRVNEADAERSYCIWWEGLSSKESTWETESCLLGHGGPSNFVDKLQTSAYWTSLIEASPSTSKPASLSANGVVNHINGRVNGQLHDRKRISKKRPSPDRGLPVPKRARVSSKQSQPQIVQRTMYQNGSTNHYDDDDDDIYLQDSGSREQFARNRIELFASLKDFNEMVERCSSDPAGLRIENRVDLALPPQDFVYLNKFHYSDADLVPSNVVVGCQCNSTTGCCASFQVKSSSSTKKKSKLELEECCADQAGYANPYDHLGCVDVSNCETYPIYECNALCLCARSAMTCRNRVVQHGRKVPLTIFRTNSKGWGVRADAHVRKGAFVLEYVGEVISVEEADRRYKDSLHSYIFDLDYSDDPVKYSVDARQMGNASHFINHSCDPNLVVFGVWIDHLYAAQPRLAFFAKREIKTGEELTFDYKHNGMQDASPAASPVKEEEHIKTAKNGPVVSVKRRVRPKAGADWIAKRCHCGTQNCRGYL